MRAAIVACLLAGCALTRNAPPLEVRYLTPPEVDATPAVRADVPRGRASIVAIVTSFWPLREVDATPPRGRVRTGKVAGSAHLRYRLVRRSSPTEVTLIDALRWTEAPEVYVRRSLRHALFVVQPIDQAVDAGAPTLDVEVIAFEDVVTPRARSGRVRLAYRLQDEEAVLASGVVMIDRPVTGQGVPAAVAAIGEAMHAATAEVAVRVARVVCAH